MSTDPYASYGATHSAPQSGLSGSIMDACRQIRETVSLSALVSASGAKLKRAGREWKGCCLFHPDRTPSFTIYADDRRFMCFGCGVQGDALDFVQRHHGIDLVEAIRMIDAGALPIVTRVERQEINQPPDRLAEAEAIWRASIPADGTLAQRYLEMRGLGGPVPPVLRFARLPYGSKGAPCPVMVALIVDAAGNPQGIQRTYLNAAGTGKAAVPKPKLSLGKVKGGAVRLAPAAGEVIVAEGIEDALTLQRGAGLPAWAAAGAGMLTGMDLPKAIRSVVIGADADDAGKAAAQAAVERFMEEGRAVRVIFPARGFKDFNAEHMAGLAVSA